MQVSSAKAPIKVDAALAQRVQQALEQAGVSADFVQFEGNSIKARFGDTDVQVKAKDAITRACRCNGARQRTRVLARTSLGSW